MLAHAYAVGLWPFTACLRKEYDFVADSELVEIRMHDIKAVEVQLGKRC